MSTLSTNPVRAGQPELTMHVFRLQGNTTSALSVVEDGGAKVTMGRPSEGLHTLTFSENPGNYIGFSWGLEDTTPANIADHWVAVDSYASKVLTFTVTDVAAGTPELQDLATTSYLTLVLYFKTANV